MGLVALASVWAALAAPVARAVPSFTFVPDPHVPVLPAGDALTAVADVNGDGVPDLIVENRGSDTLGVMLGDGSGGFGAPSSIPVGGRPLLVEVGDFNGDGHPDLLAEIETGPQPRQPNPAPEAVQVLTGAGNGGFTAGSVVALKEAGEVLVGDFAGDGHEDAAEVPGCSGSMAGFSVGDASTIYLLVGDGHGALTPGPATPVSTRGCIWSAGDFNGDGRQDLAIDSFGIAGEAPHLVVEPGEPTGRFGAPIETTLPSKASFLRGQPADLNGDHTLDLVAEGFSEPGTVYVLDNDGSGHFSVAGPYPAGTPHLVSSPIVGDFAGVGRPSILTLGPSISVLEPTAGGLAPVALVPYSGPANEVQVADINRDGRADLILSNATALSILLNEPAVPAITGARLSPHTWREGTALARLSRRAPSRGTTLSFSLNVAAGVRLAFAQRVGRPGGHATYLQRGALALQGHPGTDRVAFDGRLSRRRRLAPGAYRLTVTATNATGHSRAITLAFTIVR
jgi:hypothetical protein